MRSDIATKVPTLEKVEKRGFEPSTERSVIAPTYDLGPAGSRYFGRGSLEASKRVRWMDVKNDSSREGRVLRMLLVMKMERESAPCNNAMRRPDVDLESGGKPIEGCMREAGVAREWDLIE